MAKFNVTKKGMNKTTNYEDGEAFEFSDQREKLLHLSASCLFGEPRFYDNSGEAEWNILKTCSEVAKKDPEFILQLASYLRNEMNLRTTPIALLVKASNLNEVKGSNLISKYALSIMKRADELTEALAVQLELYGKPIPNSLKKAVAMSFVHFDEYQFGKYNRKGKVTFKDAIMLTHPKEPSVIIKKILDDALEVPYTWETELSKKGNKKAVWEDLIDSGKLPYMAMVRNLRNILTTEGTGVSEKHLKSVCMTLMDDIAVRKSKLFPYRFYSAYKEIQEIPSRWASLVMESLEIAMRKAFENMPRVDGTTFIVCDTSGSMNGEMSKFSKIQLKEVGLILGVASKRFMADSLFGCFGEKFGIYNMRSDAGIIDSVQNVMAWSERLGGSTNGWKAISYLNEKKIKVDRIMVFTDCQLYDNSGNIFFTGKDITIREEFNMYKKNVNPSVKLYLFDLNSYGTVNFPEGDRSVVNISGFSERIFDFVRTNEVDPKVQIDYIKNRKMQHEEMS